MVKVDSGSLIQPTQMACSRCLCSWKAASWCLCMSYFKLLKLHSFVQPVFTEAQWSSAVNGIVTPYLNMNAFNQKVHDIALRNQQQKTNCDSWWTRRWADSSGTNMVWLIVTWRICRRSVTSQRSELEDVQFPHRCCSQLSFFTVSSGHKPEGFSAKISSFVFNYPRMNFTVHS